MNLDKYYNKETVFIYHKKENNILESYHNCLEDKDLVMVLLGDVIAIVTNISNKCSSYFSSEEFENTLISGELTDSNQEND